MERGRRRDRRRRARTDEADGLKRKEEKRDLRQRRGQQSNGGPETQWSDQEAESHYNQPRSGESVALSGKPIQQCPGAALATGGRDPDREILGSNQDLEGEEGGALKAKGQSRWSEKKVGEANLWQRWDQQNNGGPETQRSDQEAER
ncbi:hypothetical protein NDU88_009751 [Pleurodeles waltl]|uniref:Uncharacterized protein n=1 Tax=Pleurodeles waltl TaxID=8319 RepID=A0AAV7RX02_PLEWA|nr:hypothetical protein NDU88_009751 [Pleurodeles waltl]